MSWAEVKSAINSNLKEPLDKLIKRNINTEDIPLNEKNFGMYIESFNKNITIPSNSSAGGLEEIIYGNDHPTILVTPNYIHILWFATYSKLDNITAVTYLYLKKVTIEKGVGHGYGKRFKPVYKKYGSSSSEISSQFMNYPKIKAIAYKNKYYVFYYPQTTVNLKVLIFEKEDLSDNAVEKEIELANSPSNPYGPNIGIYKNKICLMYYTTNGEKFYIETLDENLNHEVIKILSKDDVGWTSGTSPANANFGIYKDRIFLDRINLRPIDVFTNEEIYGMGSTSGSFFGARFENGYNANVTEINGFAYNFIYNVIQSSDLKNMRPFGDIDANYKAYTPSVSGNSSDKTFFVYDDKVEKFFMVKFSISSPTTGRQISFSSYLLPIIFKQMTVTNLYLPKNKIIQCEEIVSFTENCERISSDRIKVKNTDAISFVSITKIDPEKKEPHMCIY